MGGKSTKPFLVFVHEKMRRREELIVTECTEDYDEQEFVKHIQNSEYGWHFLIICPSDLGWPVHRPRKWFFAYLLSALTFISSMEVFQQVFCRRPVLVGEDLFAAPVELVREDRTDGPARLA
jgi:hypothetical protein